MLPRIRIGRAARALPRRAAPLLGAALTVLSAHAARAEISLRWSGKLQTDVRIRTSEKTIGGFYAEMAAPRGISRNENIFKLKLNATAGRFGGVAELDFVWVGYSNELESLDELSLRGEVDPFRIEAQAVYIEAIDLLVEGLELRVGQQQVFWGKGDQFNPTNTINPLDLEDPLLFGEQLANLMLKVDYAPTFDWTFSAVVVPIFKPALLPSTAPLGLMQTDRLPMLNDALRYQLHTQKAFTGGGIPGVISRFPTVVTRATPVLPETSLDNIQYALRVAGNLGGQDLAVHYYFGRTDIPQPYMNHTTLDRGQRCNPADPSDCVGGLLETNVFLAYPRMHMVALNAAGEVDALGWLWSKINPIGYRLELGVFFPQKVSMILIQDELKFGNPLVDQPASEYDYRDALGTTDPYQRPLNVDSTPFLKWVLGLDYTFNEHVYMNVQWVHGFPDEFGAGDWLVGDGEAVRAVEVDTDRFQTTSGFLDGLACVTPGQGALGCERFPKEYLRPRIGDYLVLGVDVRLLSQKLLLRLFAILDLVGVDIEQWDDQLKRRVRTHRGPFTSDGFSASIYPEFMYSFGNGFDLGGGALFNFGEEWTKFGSPEVGGHQVFTRARYQF